MIPKTYLFILRLGSNSNRKKINANIIRKDLNMSSSYIHTITKSLEKKGIIERKQQGASKILNLTKEGWEAYYSLKILEKLKL
jgi:DNA-binding MarR family transcriptional regulator